MKFKVQKHPENLESRTIKIFLIFPRKINYEWRWLEYAYIRQIYFRTHFNWHWSDQEWVN